MLPECKTLYILVFYGNNFNDNKAFFFLTRLV